MVVIFSLSVDGENKEWNAVFHKSPSVCVLDAKECTRWGGEQSCKFVISKNIAIFVQFLSGDFRS